jgi:trk system potassium uptake protein TrkA
MIVVIIGGGRTGAQLARVLLSQNHEVHLVESRPSVLARIHKELPTEVIHEGDPMDPKVLEGAKIQDANVFCATSTEDEENLALCYLARTKYDVQRTIARVNNPRNAWLFGEMFHVDAAVNQAEIMSRLIEEEMSLGDMMTLLKLKKGNYSLVEEKIIDGAPAIGKAIQELHLPESCIIAAIIRHHEIVMPHGHTRFEAGDEVLAVTDPEGARLLAEVLSVPNHNGNGNGNGNGHGNGKH